MNKRELKKFEKLLLAERERLLKGVKAIERETLYQPTSDYNISDPNSSAEAGTDHIERETALRVAGAESEMLLEIDEALERIKNGTYGVCEGSGEPIPKKRLEVFPTARYTVEYQSELEKQRNGRW
jgi:RNA polymerase-binding protein DksA